jgi:hypothetical protein
MGMVLAQFGIPVIEAGFCFEYFAFCADVNKANYKELLEII